jgi:cobaltochelatase CobT
VGRSRAASTAGRLTQLIASPTERRLFRTERQEPKADCVLAFLLDCSGSMRQHAERIAPLVDTFARALDMAGVANEVLGFTTSAWNGGKASGSGVRAGRPTHPGRLNEALHIVFKDADTPWRRGRAGLAALFKGEMFKEGIDGEAVEWAVARLEARSEPHKLLVVVSDACPMDGATNLANDPNYLDHHLQDVVQRVEAAGRVRIHGLGVGLDLSPYYGRSQALDLAVETPREVIRETLHLLAQRGGR